LLGPVDLSEWIDELNWVIAGGESGPHARQSSPSWFRSLRDQCRAAKVGFHFKQWGDWFPLEESPENVRFERRGKAKAGRLLDGRTWDQAPNVA
jgi:protein gp37